MANWPVLYCVTDQPLSIVFQGG
ncbi:hypothetical protein CCACVL1_00258 [Corchorus capsularis]|uniref:Uncharacterized protein n=1 Tax=Corchorus capsularis TaxID=210143 RepID=A0A1R3KXH6_COCAP|nr:hypothetical protein CCACVL1_00258 [Corchorus capsularis]